MASKDDNPDVKSPRAAGAFAGDFPDLLTPEQAAQLLQVHPETVRQLARRGQIPARKIGKHWRISRRQLLGDDFAGGNAPEKHARESRHADGVATFADAAETVTQREAARLLGVSLRTVDRMVRDGRLATVRTGKAGGWRKILRSSLPSDAER